MIINELVTKLSFKQDKGLSGYQKSMMNAQRSTERAAKGMENAMGKSTSAIGKMMNFVMKVNGVHESKKNIDSVGSSIRNVANELKMLVGGYAAVNAAQKAASFMFSATAEKETALTQLTTLVGKDKAGGIFKDLQKFAATTPYELKDVMEMFNRLEGAGFGMLDKSGRVQYDKLTKLGDLSSASNKPLSELTDTILSANRGLGSMVDNFVGLSAKAEDGALAVTMFDRATGKTTTKKVQSGDKAGIMDFFTQAAERKGIKGGMGELSKTLTGQMSTLTDSAKNLATVFSGGFIDKVHKLLEGTIKQLDKMEPQFKSMGAAAGKFINDMPRLFKEAQPYMEGCAAALAGMATSYGVMQAMAVIKWLNTSIIMWRGMDMAMRLAAISGWAANAAVMALPIAIAAAVAAVAWFGWQVYKYMTQGTDALMGLRNQFPFLADSVMFVGELIKTWVPIVMQVANVVYGVLSLAFQGFMIVVQSLYANTFKPFVDFALWGLNGILWAIKKVTIDSDTWRAGVVAIQGAFKTMYETVKPWLDALGILLNSIGQGIADAVSKLPQLPGFLGGGGGQDQDAGQQGFAGYNAVFGGKFAQTAKQVAASMNTVNKCAYGFETSFEKMTGIALRGHAFELKNQMDRNRLYKKVQVTDEQMKNLPPGFVVIHDKNDAYKGKGLGGKYGHVSVSLGNGMEASDHIQKQMVRHYAGGQRYVYMPVGGSGGGGGAAPVANVTVNVAGTNASPKQIGNAAQNGTNKALTKAKQQQRVAVNPGAK